MSELPAVVNTRVRRRLVLLESAASMGGVQFSTLYLAQALDAAHWQPIVICPGEGDLTRLCRESGIEAQIVLQPRMWSTSLRVGANFRIPNPFAWIWNAMAAKRAAGRLRGSLRQCSPDLVVTKGLSTHFIGGSAARELGIPCIWHVQDLISERTFGIYRRIFGFAAQRLPKQIIADGAAIREQLPASVRARTAVIHNGVNTSVFRPAIDGTAVREELGISRDELVIGHAGRITPWKGQHYLIEAFARIAERYPNVTLLLAGAPVFDHDGYEQQLRKMAAVPGLQDRIKFAGYRHDLPNVLAAMDVFAFTSIEKDTSPLALLSAMSSGLPIVAFDIDGVRELIDADEQLLRVPVEDSEELANALMRLIADGELRLRLGRAARELAERKYSLEKYVNGIDAVFINAVRSGLKIEAHDHQIASISPAGSVSSVVQS